MKKKTKKLPFYRQKLFLWPGGILAGIIIATLLAFRFSPWPGVLLIRHVFDQGSQKTLRGLEPHTPSTAITVLPNQQYKESDHDALLDVYVPEEAVSSNKALPVVVWTHGGAWLSGDKANAAPYFKLIASQGFTVVSLNYSLAPGKKYPEQIHQLNEAHAYIQANATRFHADVGKIVLAGDSAGAQLSSQMAALITNPEYAKEVGLQPALPSSRLAGVVLFCGIYKMEGLVQPDPTLPKIVSWGDDVTVWAYTGSRNKSSPAIGEMSAYYHVTKDFPATFITGGNGDPLTNGQSIPMANELKNLGVDVISLFYPENHMPSLPHEYQFTLDNDGQKAFDSMIMFLKEKTQTRVSG